MTLLTKHIIRPEYDKFPAKSAPIIRNETIVKMSDILLAFWDGKSKGTLSTIKLARKLWKEIIIYIVENGNEIHKTNIV